VSRSESSTLARPCRAAPLPPHERRAAIIAATLPLLAEHGSAVTTRQVAAAAGVSEGTIFNVFADKDDLIAAAFEAAIDPAPYERAIAEIDGRASFEQQLVRATELTQRRIVDIWRLVSQIGPRQHPKHGPLPDSAALLALFERSRRRLRIEPLEAARLLRALTLSLTHPMLATEPRPAEAIVDLFLRGAAGRGRRA
jgi:AcrR family transcriptional regulator